MVQVADFLVGSQLILEILILILTVQINQGLLFPLLAQDKETVEVGHNSKGKEGNNNRIQIIGQLGNDACVCKAEKAFFDIESDGNQKGHHGSLMSMDAVHFFKIQVGRDHVKH